MMIKKSLISIITLSSLVYSFTVTSCPICRTKLGTAVRDGLFGHDFTFILSIIVSIFSFFVIIVAIICYLLANIINTNISNNYHQSHNHHMLISQFLFALMLFGGGLAGLLDGIVFHQMLQTHNMISNILPLNSLVNAEINMFWDGVFDAHIFLIILISMVLFWRVKKNSNNYHSRLMFIGSLFTGAGIFNLIEGLIDHQFYKLHHVIQYSNSIIIWYSDLVFILVAIMMIILGGLYLKKSIKQI